MSGSSRSFHFGVDVVARDGTPVYAVVDGKIFIENPNAVAVDAGGVDFGYWHIVPAVRHGQRVRRGDLLGRVLAPWGHVHFAERRGGIYRDPLRPGALAPWSDPTSPRIAAISFERDGRVVPPGAVSGAVDVVVEAYDRPPLPIPDPPWAGAILTPALVRWRVLSGGRVVRPWHTPVDFRTLVPKERFAAVYASGTRQNRPGKPGRYRFFVAHTWTTRLLPDGAYRLEAEAVDERGNLARAGLAFTLANGV
ncbi:MAG TPA: M23 family metallopeptidase [Gaiellaceae bacterium]